MTIETISRAIEQFIEEYYPKSRRVCYNERNVAKNKAKKYYLMYLLYHDLNMAVDDIKNAIKSNIDEKNILKTILLIDSWVKLGTHSRHDIPIAIKRIRGNYKKNAGVL